MEPSIVHTSQNGRWALVLKETFTKPVQPGLTRRRLDE